MNLEAVKIQKIDVAGLGGNYNLVSEE